MAGLLNTAARPDTASLLQAAARVVSYAAVRLFLAVFLAATASLAMEAREKRNWGTLSGSLESNSIYYMHDAGLDPSSSVNPDDRFGTNNFLKLDYMNGRFSAGLQMEGFLPALQGYDYLVYGNGRKVILGSKYVSWQDDMYGFRVGDIFEQYGNGLIFRSYEDRALGFNNSLEGVHGRFDWKGVHLSAMFGRPRLYLEYAESMVRGADLCLSLSEMTGWDAASLSIEGSYVNRYENLMENELFADLLTTNSLDMYSARANFDWKGLSAKFEYAGKSKDLPDAASREMLTGNAILAELGYSYRRFSVLGTFRRLVNMNTMISLNAAGTGNTLNYLPALTRQHTYMLASLNPYQVNANGEIGGQADVYYSLRSKTTRSKYWNFHVNFSTYYTDASHTGGRSNLLWRDINADVERQWNKRWKTAVLVSIQEWSPSHGMQESTYASNIFVVDNTCKITDKMSVRLELQYLYSANYEKDWMAGLLEFNMAPHWSVTISDMYNHGSSGKHYYNASVSYTRKSTRIQLGYGRVRAGYICSGGVCRWTPAYTGANLTITSSF